MNRNLKAMREERIELLDKREQTLQRVDRGGKSNPSASKELRACEAITADIKALDEEIAKETAREESIKRRLHDGDIESRNAWGNPTSGGEQLSPSERKRAFNAWARCGSSLAPTESGLELARRAGFSPNDRGLYFNLPEVRAMGSLDATKGAKAVPQGFERSLERALLAYGNVRAVSRVIQTGGGGELRFPTANDTGNKGRRLNENSQAQNTDVVISEVKLDAYKYSSDIVLCSVELLQDEEVELESHIGSLLGERLGRIVNEDLTTGSGVDEPKGVVTASTLGKAAAATGVVTYGELVDLQHSLGYANQSNASWMMSFATLSALKKIVDGENRPLWQASSDSGFGGSFPGTILGRPYVINEDMPALGASAKPILYGDFSKYLVREVKGVQLMRLNERFADYHQVAFLAYLRTDGDLLDAGTHPLRHMVMAAS